MTKSLRTAKMSRTLNMRSPEHEAGVQTATYIINVAHRYSRRQQYMNCTKLLLLQERTEFPRLLNRAITLTF